jgi:hypothetical protein
VSPAVPSTVTRPARSAGFQVGRLRAERAGRPHQHPDRVPVVGGGDQQQRPGRLGQLLDPPPVRVLHPAADRPQPDREPGRRRLAGSLSRGQPGRQREQGQRVAGRLGEDPVPGRRGQVGVVLGQQRGRVPVVQRRRPQLGQPGVRERALAVADREDQHDRLFGQPAGGEQQRRRGLAVQPLRVVDQYQQRRLFGEVGQQREHGQPDQQRVLGRRGGQPERGPERPRLHRRQTVDPVGPRAQQQEQRRVRELGLGLDPAAAQHRRAGLDGGPGGVVEQCRLADPGLAAQHQRAAASGPGAGEQPVEELDLGPASQQHDRTLVR